jgi:BON domain-containing protein
MARDFENLDDLDDLSDGELRNLVRDRLAEHRGLDPRDITVTVHDRVVALDGRVGTEGERRVAERVVTDLIGITTVRNNLVVDELRRAESPEAVDEHIADEDEHAGLLLGDRAVPLSPEAEHLAEDLDSRLFGTTDVGSAIQNGTAWIPPTSPTQEGIEGQDEFPADDGEDRLSS